MFTLRDALTTLNAVNYDTGNSTKIQQRHFDIGTWKYQLVFIIYNFFFITGAMSLLTIIFNFHNYYYTHCKVSLLQNNNGIRIVKR